MDWRLTAAVSAAGGSLCFVAFGAYVVFTHNPAPQRAAAPAPMLLSEYRSPAVTTPSLMSVQPATPSLFAPTVFGSAASPFAPEGDAAPPAFPAPPLVTDRTGAASSHSAAAPGHTAALTPFDAAPQREPPPRPAVEVKKSSVVPELHTALPSARYRGVLTSAEIVRLKSRLRLTPEQERAWPPVEAALAELGRQQIVLIHRGQEPRISPSDWPPGRLYAIAGPLLQTLRPDQKETVRRLCRSLGFEGVASMI